MAVAVAAGVAAAAADGGGKETMRTENFMNNTTTVNEINVSWKKVAGMAATILCLALSTSVSAHAQTAAAKPAAAKPAAPAQKSFATAKEAADAFVAAASSYDVPALLAILGPDGKALVESDDSVQDKNRAEAFAAKAKEKEEVQPDPKNPAVAMLIVGNDDFPLPIPIVQKAGKWSFDTKAGKQEVLRRRVGANELDAINICRGFVEAQLEYAKTIHDDSGVNQYAQKIISTSGKHDGLAWQNPDGTWGGPVGEAVAKAIAEGYSDTEKRDPFHGYYFKVLKGQGPAARLGKLDYMVKGAMIGGFALVAWPAEYRVTGVQTFIVSYDGVVYQKDLGPDTNKIASAMERYNPDTTWKETDDEDPDN